MKILRIILGPEVCWIVLFIISIILANSNKKYNYALDGIIENVWFYVPLLSVSIFGLYWIPIVEKNGLLLRIWITGVFMGHLVLEKLLASHSSQGPGIGMGYLAGMLLLFVLLVVGSVAVKLMH